MKNKILKILGIVLTLAMLSGLLLAAMPVSVSAANLSWSNQTLPLVSQGTSANVYSFSGDGKTIYAWTAGIIYNNTSTAIELYKSTDGGATWSNSSLDNSTPDVISAAGVVVKQLVVNPDNVNDIIATGVDGSGVYHVWRSINAGQTFYDFPPFISSPNGFKINSLDVRNGSSGLVSIIVGYSATANAPATLAGGVALFDSSVGTWRTSSTSANATVTGALGSSTTWVMLRL